MAGSSSPFGSRAKKRELIRDIKGRAPKHPKAPEAQIRLAVARIVDAYHKRLRSEVVDVAPMILRKRQRNDAKKDRLLVSALSSAADYGNQLLRDSGFRAALDRASETLAKSVTKQTSEALGLGKDFKPDLKAKSNELSDSIFRRTVELMQESSQRAEDILDEWADLDPDYSERAEDEDALDGMISKGLSGLLGTAIAGATLAFGSMFAEMVRASQEDAGVDSYMWMTARDSKVRPAHLDLDGEIAEWDDPPLKAEDSDNEEDDHPGEDYGCRCVASPIAADEVLSARQAVRL